ncbi:hpcH/HpaI aldolase/citrate lyase family protein [Paraburkholderia xenovorans LB400]|uniref:Citryl-CoA lyase n=1 Tax=Paraburkholderia xenovorans (strain LB400) TaxID=266265 RepID=Q13I98_PARXL|nr:CoA ester lyase [Paraburkholderia xenovorans]ABE36191.1 Citryl-CoA lyase [Paraburkholderia xenovorans LB400]AIP33889.1 hpcH/HpaI aldolase/citrate lyase family protein [Paraburkholderia xenovorans LB400]
MASRSLLFIPGDSEKKLAKGESTAADALILDLEDSVSASRLQMARGLVHEYLAARRKDRRQKLWVRINPLSSPLALQDLAQVIPGRPDGIMLPKLKSAKEVVTLDNYLSAFEAASGQEPGQTQIIPVATETAASIFRLGEYSGISSRIAGLTWGAEDLATALGARENRQPDGTYDLTYQLARSLCLLGSAAASVPAIDTITADFRNESLLRSECDDARRAGFKAKMAIHPDQVPVINELFLPGEAEVVQARRIIEAFEQADGAGTVQLDGSMLDMPHLKRARDVIGMVNGLS